MLRVLTKVRTFVNGATRDAGEEIAILDHLFSEEVHTILEDLGVDKNPIGNPVIPGREPPVTSTPEPPAPEPPPSLEPAPAAASTKEKSK